MLVACRLAGLSALEAHYASMVTLMQTERNSGAAFRQAQAAAALI
jgi:hypothetical protein